MQISPGFVSPSVHMQGEEKERQWAEGKGMCVAYWERSLKSPSVWENTAHFTAAEQSVGDKWRAGERQITTKGRQTEKERKKRETYSVDASRLHLPVHWSGVSVALRVWYDESVWREAVWEWAFVSVWGQVSRQQQWYAASAPLCCICTEWEWDGLTSLHLFFSPPSLYFPLLLSPSLLLSCSHSYDN